MTVYALLDELKTRWPDLPLSLETTAEALLGDASLILDQEAPAPAEPLPADLDVRRMVVCSMVKRALASGVPGAASLQETAGPFSRGVTFANPGGDLYLTRAEKRLLGVRPQEAFTVPAACDESSGPLGWLP